MLKIAGNIFPFKEIKLNWNNESVPEFWLKMNVKFNLFLNLFNIFFKQFKRFKLLVYVHSSEIIINQLNDEIARKVNLVSVIKIN